MRENGARELTVVGAGHRWEQQNSGPVGKDDVGRGDNVRRSGKWEVQRSCGVLYRPSGKSTDPADKDAWKDKGTGQLSIKRKEGVSKSTRESKPTVLVRNDVGKILLNALLYPGIKTNMQKNYVVAIFHTTPDGGNSSGVVARTFLIRTKTEEDQNKLAAVIQEYSPAT